MQKPRELTPSSITLGIIIGVIMTAANVYLGLYAGMTISASIPAAVLAMGVYNGVLRRPALHESNIVQTMASSGESLAAGIIFTLPALIIVGIWKDFDFWPTTLIAMAGGLLGVIFMIPLRRALIVEDKTLTYPEGVACAAVLKSGVESDEEGKKGFYMILQGLGLGALAKFLSQGVNLTLGSVEYAKKIGQSSIFGGMDISPALVAVGYIVKLEVAILVFIGGMIGFSVAIPLLGTPAGMENLSAIDLAWSLWSSEVRYLGVGAMIVGGLYSIYSVRRGISSGLQGLRAVYGDKEEKAHHEKDIPLWLMASTLMVCFFIMFFLYHSMIGHLGFTLMTTIVMLICSFIFVAVSSYIVGLVGSSNNPVSGMTISALLVSSALFLALGETGESGILSTLGVAAIVCCAACTAGDTSQDLKTGSIIKASPFSQQIASIIGIIVPAFVIAPVLTLLHHSYGIGDGLKAPQAALFASITQALFGEGNLPMKMVIIGAVSGIAIIAIDKIFLKNSKFRLHLMPLAVGIYLPVTLATPILIGGLIREVIDRKKAKAGTLDESRDKGVLLSSGYIAGEALMGVLVAILLYNAIDISISGVAETVQQVLSLAVIALLSFFLWRKAKL